MKTRSLFGHFMRREREHYNLSRSELAYRIGCDVRRVEMVEDASRKVPDELLVAWANELRLQPEVIHLVWLNEESRCTCITAGLAVLVKSSLSEDHHDRTNLQPTPLRSHAGRH